MNLNTEVKRTVDLAVDELRQRILNSTYPIGSKLPSERKLAEEFQINRLTLRSALRHLEAEGFLKPHHGQGVLVLDYKETASIELLIHSKEANHVAEVLNLRKILAAEAIGEACIEATITDVNRLKSILHKQSQAVSDHEFLEGDLHFMNILVASSKNFALQLLFNSFERIIRAHPEIHAQITSNKAQALSSYQVLISLLKTRNETLAKKAILGYLTPEEEAELGRLLSA